MYLLLSFVGSSSAATRLLMDLLCGRDRVGLISAPTLENTLTKGASRAASSGRVGRLFVFA